MQKLLFILYLIYEVGQIAAITLGIQYYFDMDLMISMPVGVILALIPFIGTIIAIYAAMLVWELHWMVATSAFVLPGVAILVLAMLGEVSENHTAQHAAANGDHNGRKKPIKKKMKEDDF